MQLTDCVFDRWSPTIGDPTFMGWFTVFAYGTTAVLCFLAFAYRGKTGEKKFGLFLAVILACLMINKQLDLQSALTAFGRCLSQAQGWYEQRHFAQLLFIFALLLAASILALALFWTMRRQIRSTWLAMTGFLCVVLFVAVRAVGFHHFDALIGVQVHSVKMNWVLELGGLAMIATNAVWLLWFRQQSGRAPTQDRL